VGLIVDFNNPRAEALYTSLGFERVGRKNFLGHPMWHLQYAKKKGDNIHVYTNLFAN
jgi:ribosomal protein S18 acetylase RimI-like enzyme